MFNKIITVTPNTSLDVAMWVKSRELEVAHDVIYERIDAGGKGVNVSKVLNSLGEECVALGFAGVDNVSVHKAKLKTENTPCAFVEVEGKIRENIIINVEGEHPLRVNRKGYTVTDDDIKKLLELIKSHIVENTLIHFGGSIPSGFTNDAYVEMINELSKYAKISVDTAKLTMEDYKKMKLYLIKPNTEEVSALLGYEIETLEEALKASDELLPFVENVMISLGADGMLIANENGKHTVKAPKVELKSTVGAGDTSIAGFLFAKQQGKDDGDALKFAAACGSASVMLEGTEAITLKQAEEVLNLIK